MFAVPAYFRVCIQQFAVRFFALLLIAGLFFSSLGVPQPVQAAGGLTVEIVAAPNLVVDSNVLSPSSYAPSVATVIGKFCNTGSTTLTNVKGLIGDAGAGTPGVYPRRSPADGTAFTSVHPHLSGPYWPSGTYYSFIHLGGQRGLADASRVIGSLPPGECRVQYWHFTYPRRSNLAASSDNQGSQPVWGASSSPQDDLYLFFDVWATADGLTAVSQRHKMTMRNQISAMANKIRPNPDGVWFNTNTDIVLPGETVTSNGINYNLGNINKGFDNDGDFQPDYNAWLQPVGDDAFDPSCFRLIESHGTITVTRSGGNPPYIEHFQDKLYFTNLPADNTGGVGTVYYTFLALSGPCSSRLTPYQEVASGSDNEKFSADYGAGVPPVGSAAVQVSVDKSSSPTVAAVDTIITYSIPVYNHGSAGAGLPLMVYGAGESQTVVRMPLTIQDQIPSGTVYVGGSAGYTLPGSETATLEYSEDGGLTWNSAPSGPATVTSLRWVFDQPLRAGESGTVFFSVKVSSSYTDAFVENEACGSFGDGIPFDCGATTTLIEGVGQIGDLVWHDLNSDGLQAALEPGLPNISVSLYYDRDGNKSLDEGDILISSQITGPSGEYLFEKLPAGRYLVSVDPADSDIPTGVAPSTPILHAILLTSSVLADTSADFGFGPSLVLDKMLLSAATAKKGSLIDYRINLINTRSGDGSGSGACRYTAWATIPYTTTGTLPAGGNSTNARWSDGQKALFTPDAQYTIASMGNNINYLGLGGFTFGPQPGAVQKVEWVLYLRETLKMVGGEQLTLSTYRADQTNAAQDVTIPLASQFSSASVSTVRVDITSLQSPWTWDDFGHYLDGSRVELRLAAAKAQGGQTGELGLDAVALVVTTDETSCGGPNYDIVTLPLVDTFDADLLTFVSASPAPAQVTYTGTAPNTTGTLTWTNLGPLFAGQIKPVEVTLRALTNISDPVTTINTAAVTEARFGSGRPVNTAVDTAGVTLHGSGVITGVVWSERQGGAQGWVGAAGYEASDFRIPNVTLRLYGCYKNGQMITAATAQTNQSCAQQGGVWTEVPGAAQVTNASGEYRFEGVADGFYYIQVDSSTLPGSPAPSAEPIQNGTGLSCPTCSGYWAPATGINANLRTTTFNPIDQLNETISNVNFGYSYGTTAALQGVVYKDYDVSGARDSSEDGVSGVTVSLCTSPDCTTVVMTTTTNASGAYSFTGVSLITPYYLRVTAGAGSPVAGWANTDDPGTGPLDNVSDAIQVALGGTVSGPHNFGYAPAGSLSIGDQLYYDWNNNGLPDAGEDGIPNVGISLYIDGNGNGVVDYGERLHASTITGSNGEYSFNGLWAGKYLVVVDETSPGLPGGYFQSGDPDETGVCTGCDGFARVVLASSSLTSVDFGYRSQGSASLGDLVFVDLDGDGFYAAGDTGLANITLWLYEDTNNNGLVDPLQDALVATTTSGSGGFYGFSGLPAGNYLVQVDAGDPDLPAGYTLSSASPHDVKGTSTQTASGLSAGEAYLGADFGFTPGGVIGDLVWQDNNQDGFRDPSETGLAGITLRLYSYTDANGSGQYEAGEPLSTALQSVVTDPQGYYTFTQVTANPAYVVRVEAGVPAGFVQTYDPGAPVTAIGCFIPGSCHSYASLSLSAGQTDRSLDFAYRPLNALGDRLWVDIDQDGVQEAGEPGLSNVRVDLMQAESVLLTTTTDGDGFYSFGGLIPGSYTVVVHAPANVVQTFDPDGQLDNRFSLLVAVDTLNLEIDFGYRFVLTPGLNSVGGTVFFDANDNAIREPGETTIYPGVTVYLWDSRRSLAATTVSGPDGSYSFSSLPDGAYYISINSQAPELFGLSPTQTLQPTYYRQVNLVDSADIAQQDFGFLSTLDLGDLPAGYTNTLLLHNGARHNVGDLFLGSEVSVDADGKPDASAEGDAGDDGVQRLPGQTWAPGAAVELFVTVSKAGGFLVGWFNWNGDGDFADPSEMVIFGPVAAGSQTLLLAVPGEAGYVTNRPLDVRFRLYASNPGTPTLTGLASDGEVEDYHWVFSPTSVLLEAMGSQTGARVPLLFVGVMVCALGLLLSARRRRLN